MNGIRVWGIVVVVFGQTFSLIDANMFEPCYCDGLMGYNA